jgi:hypothetical protein
MEWYSHGTIIGNILMIPQAKEHEKGINLDNILSTNKFYWQSA